MGGKKEEHYSSVSMTVSMEPDYKSNHQSSGCIQGGRSVSGTAPGEPGFGMEWETVAGVVGWPVGCASYFLTWEVIGLSHRVIRRWTRHHPGLSL